MSFYQNQFRHFQVDSGSFKQNSSRSTRKALAYHKLIAPFKNSQWSAFLFSLSFYKKKNLTNRGVMSLPLLQQNFPSPPSTSMLRKRHFPHTHSLENSRTGYHSGKYVIPSSAGQAKTEVVIRLMADVNTKLAAIWKALGANELFHLPIRIFLLFLFFFC